MATAPRMTGRAAPGKQGRSPLPPDERGGEKPIYGDRHEVQHSPEAGLDQYTEIPGYRIESLIGRGGMGVV
jgi:hypothetical protein